MADFRVLFFNAEGKVARAITLSFANEEQAVATLEKLGHPYDVELWKGIQRLHSFPGSFAGHEKDEDKDGR
ncbi:MAG: hypothetical protein ACHP84_06205 [Caulobacterales bacterium]